MMYRSDMFVGKSTADAIPRRRILVVLHQKHSTPGRVGRMLRDLGYDLDIRRPALGDELPDPRRSEHCGAVVFGGPMSANDPDQYIQDEIKFIGDALDCDYPVLGICLGAQLMVRALGGQVGEHDEGLVEIGYYDLHPTDQGRDLIWWPGTVYEWHREGFDLPTGATLLASTKDYPHQAFAFGHNSFALQFHIELTLAMLCKWTVRGRHRLSMPGARQRADHFSDRLVFDRDHMAWSMDFLRMWTEKLPVESR